MKQPVSKRIGLEEMVASIGKDDLVAFGGGGIH